MTGFLLVLGGAVVLFVAYAAYTLRRVNTPTTGPPIDRAARPETALVVIDVQEDFAGDKAGWDPACRDARLDAIRSAVAEARERGEPVLTVRHAFRHPLLRFVIRLVAGGRGIVGSKGLGLLPALDIAADADVLKHESDSLSAPAFERWLADNRVGALVLVGLDGCHCVQNTANGALNRGYAVRILPDGVLAHNEAGWQRHRERLAARGAVVA